MSPEEKKSGMHRREAIRRAALSVGAVLSFSTIEALAKADPAKGSKRYLSEDQYATLAAFVDVLLPRTDTPGGADVGVPGFVDMFAGRYATEGEARTLKRGLDGLDEASVKLYNKHFQTVGEDAQLALLKEWATSGDKTKTSGLEKLREFALLGYFSSEEVSTKVLKYLPVPGHFEGCVDLDEATGGVAWSV